MDFCSEVGDDPIGGGERLRKFRVEPKRGDTVSIGLQVVDQFFISESLFRLHRGNHPLFDVIKGEALGGWFVAYTAMLPFLCKSHTPLHSLNIQLCEGKR